MPTTFLLLHIFSPTSNSGPEHVINYLSECASRFYKTDQLSLFQSGGADYAYQIPNPPDFQTFHLLWTGTGNEILERKCIQVLQNRGSIS